MRRFLALIVVLAALVFSGCAHQVGTVGYVGGERISEAEVDRATIAFAPYGYHRGDVTLFLVEARVAQYVMKTKGLGPDPGSRTRAADIPEVKRVLDDPATRDVMLGVIDFLTLETQLDHHGMAVAIADSVVLDPRYGELGRVVDPTTGELQYVLTGHVSEGQSGGLSTVAPK